MTSKITFDLPKEVTIWNKMNGDEKMAVMNKVPYNRSTTKWYRACIKYVRENMAEFEKFLS
jgi:predicted Fe-S protein YdhL (DUF1289 family)